MKLKSTLLAAAVLALFGAQAAMAQDKNREEVKSEARAAAKSGTMPADAADQGLPKPKPKAAPKTKKKLGEARAKERAEAKAAVRAGDIPKDADAQGTAKPAPSGKTRAEVREETKAAVKAGEVPKGEVPDMTKKQ